MPIVNNQNKKPTKTCEEPQWLLGLLERLAKFAVINLKNLRKPIWPKVTATSLVEPLVYVS